MREKFDLFLRSIIAALIVIFGGIFLFFCFLLDLGCLFFHKIKRALYES